MTIKESLDVLAGWIEERTREKRYPEREVKELSKALLNIRDMAEDQLIRHKWPEEKPESLTYVLISRMSFVGEPRNHVAWYTKDGEFHVYGYDEPVGDITHWWDLPERKK